jgi:AcrR family transcriptional regulator
VAGTLPSGNTRNAEKLSNPRYQSILNVAAKVFRQKGYHHATISDIAREVGLQKGSLYHHIESKEELLHEIVISSLALYVGSLKQILNSATAPQDAVREAIIAHMAPIDMQFDRIYVFLNEAHNLSKERKGEVDIQLNEYERLWIEVLKRGKRKRVFRADLDCKITMLSIFGMCNWSLRWYKQQGKYSAKALGEMYAKSILHGIMKKPEISGSALLARKRQPFMR